jgi:hypothetical protein
MSNEGGTKTYAEAAAQLGCVAKTIERGVAAGKIPCVVSAGGRKAVPAVWLEAELARRKAAGRESTQLEKEREALIAESIELGAKLQELEAAAPDREQARLQRAAAHEASVLAAVRSGGPVPELAPPIADPVSIVRKRLAELLGGEHVQEVARRKSGLRADEREHPDRTKVYRTIRDQSGGEIRALEFRLARARYAEAVADRDELVSAALDQIRAAVPALASAIATINRACAPANELRPAAREHEEPTLRVEEIPGLSVIAATRKLIAAISGE